MKSDFKVVPYTLPNGNKIDLIISFYLLSKLKVVNPDLYMRFNTTLMSGLSDMLDAVMVLYAGYVCGMIAQDKVAEAMGEEEFLQALENDFSAFKVAATLVSIKKK